METPRISTFKRKPLQDISNHPDTVWDFPQSAKKLVTYKTRKPREDDEYSEADSLAHIFNKDNMLDAFSNVKSDESFSEITQIIDQLSSTPKQPALLKTTPESPDPIVSYEKPVFKSINIKIQRVEPLPNTMY